MSEVIVNLFNVQNTAFHIGLFSDVLVFIGYGSFAEPSSEGQSLLVIDSEIGTNLYSSIHKPILSIFFHSTFLSKDLIYIMSIWLKKSKKSIGV